MPAEKGMNGIALAEKIEECFFSGNSYTMTASAFNDVSRKYEWSAVAGKFKQLYEEIIR